MPNIPTIEVRTATLDDVPAMHDLVVKYAERGDLLPRSAESITLTINDWVVAIVDGQIMGIGSLLFYSQTLAEVRSLAVADEAQGLGLGRAIVEKLEALGDEKEVQTVFALTRAVPFFERLEYEITEREYFPEKIWHACQFCPIQDNCDETAVVKTLSKT